MIGNEWREIGVNVEAFRASLAQETPPEGLAPALPCQNAAGDQTGALRGERRGHAEDGDPAAPGQRKERFRIHR